MVLLTGLGDVVHGLPVVNALKAAYPDSHITWVVEPMPAGILRHHPSVDRVVVFHKARGWRGVVELARELRSQRFDLTLNLNVYFKSIWPTLLSRAPRRVGFGRDRASDGVWLTATEPLPRRPRRHTQDMFLEFLDHLEVPAEPLEWRIPFTPEEDEAAAAFFAPLGDRPVVTLIAASASRRKDWLADRYAEVADALVADFDCRVVLAGGPGAREQGIAREIVERSAVEPVWALGDSIRRLAWILRGSALVIAPDTGPLHVARALGVPVVGLFGHTNPWRVGPYRWCEDLWIDRYTEPGTAPDPSHNDPRLGRMEAITTAEVLERVERAVRRFGIGR